MSLLKALRERKRISRREVSRRTRLSTYQVEGLEGKSTQSLFERISLYVAALGYKVEDVLNLMEPIHKSGSKLSKGTLSNSLSETTFEEGVKLLTYAQQNGSFFCQLKLSPRKSLGREHLPASDIILGIVREGTLVVDTFFEQSVHKKDQFFVLFDNLPVQFINGDGNVPISVFLFSVKHP